MSEEDYVQIIEDIIEAAYLNARDIDEEEAARINTAWQSWH